MRELAAFYAVAALFGFIYAGTMPLYSVLVRENFPLRMMGTVIGGTAMAGSLGMATGPVAGGLIYDTFASYAWLYIGSWAVGLGAFLIAMTFRPFPKGCDAARADAGVKPNSARELDCESGRRFDRSARAVAQPVDSRATMRWAWAGPSLWVCIQRLATAPKQFVRLDIGTNLARRDRGFKQGSKRRLKTLLEICAQGCRRPGFPSAGRWRVRV